MIIPLKNAAGTQMDRQQTKITQPCWIGTNGVHFPDGRLTTLTGFFEDNLDSDTAMSGVCRSIYMHKISDISVRNVWIFGTNERFYAYQNGVLTNITPFAGQKHVSLGANPLDCHSGNATVDVHYTAHGVAVGDLVEIAGAETIDSINADTYINKKHLVTAIVGADEFSITVGTTAGSTVTGGGGSNITVLSIEATHVFSTNALSLTSGDATLTVSYTAHGREVGDRVMLYGVANFGGVTASTYINIEHIIATVPTANSFTIELDVAAGSTATGGNGASLFTPMAAGNLDQGSAMGFGAGDFGAGVFGAAIFDDGGQSFPRIPSCSSFGDSIVMCAGDMTAGDGQKLYIWDGDMDIAPTVWLDAPTDCNWIDIINNQPVALCGRKLKAGQTDATTGAVAWSGYGYYETTLRNVYAAVSSEKYGDKTALIFNPSKQPALLRYTGDEQVWDVSDLQDADGMIAPMAACSLDGRIYYMGATGRINVFDGASITRVKNEQNGDFIAGDINYGASWKIHAFKDQLHSQIWFFYPSGTSTECNAYAIVNPSGGHVTLGRITRTASQRPQMMDALFYMTDDESIVYRHFTGEAATHEWEAQSAMMSIDGQMNRYAATKLYMDGNQDGNATLTMYGSEYSRETPSDFGSDTVTSSTEYVSPHAAGKYLGYGFAGNADFTLGDISLEVERC